MDRVLKLFLKFLCKLRFTRGFIHYFLKRWALLLAVMFRKTEQADCSFRGRWTQFESREWVTAASYVPAQHHVLGASRQPQPGTPNAACAPAAHLVAEPDHGDWAYPTSSGGTDSQEGGQPSRFLRAADGYLGHGEYASTSRELLSRSPSPRDHSPLLPPPSLAHVTSSTPSNPGRRGRLSTATAVVGVKGSSTVSLHLHPLTSPPPLTGEPYVIAPSTTHSSPISDALHLCEGPPQLSTRTSITLSNTNLPSGCSVKPMNPDQVPRYTRSITVPRKRPDYEIQPFTTTFHPEQGPPETCAPWVSATHPDGALYFFDPARRLFTDTDMHSPEFRGAIEVTYRHLRKILPAERIPSKNYDFVLDMREEGGQMQWFYYYACHKKRCLFWLEAYDAKDMISEVYWVASAAHVKHRLEALYWSHWSLYSNVLSVGVLNRRSMMSSWEYCRMAVSM